MENPDLDWMILGVPLLSPSFGHLHIDQTEPGYDMAIVNLFSGMSPLEQTWAWTRKNMNMDVLHLGVSEDARHSPQSVFLFLTLWELLSGNLT